MEVFPGYGADPATQLWIASRYALSLAFLLAPLFLGRRLWPGAAFAAWAAATAVVVLAIFRWKVFPACYVEELEPDPLTPFKKISEIVIALMFLAAIPLAYARRQYLDRDSLRLIAGALTASALAELPFILYTKAEDPLNLFGHVLLIVAAFLILKALVETNLEKVRRSLEVGASPEGAESQSHPPPFDPWVLLVARTLSRTCSVLVMAIGLLVLAGWSFHVEGLKTLLAHGVTLKPNAALCLLLAALSLWIAQGSPTTARRFGQVLAGVVAVIGALTFVEVLSAWDLRIDYALFGDPPAVPGGVSPSRMGPPAAVCFLLFGVALLLFNSRSQGRRRLSQMLALIAGTVGLGPLIGYLYDAPDCTP